MLDANGLRIVFLVVVYLAAVVAVIHLSARRCPNSLWLGIPLCWVGPLSLFYLGPVKGLFGTLLIVLLAALACGLTGNILCGWFVSGAASTVLMVAWMPRENPGLS